VATRPRGLGQCWCSVLCGGGVKPPSDSSLRPEPVGERPAGVGKRAECAGRGRRTPAALTRATPLAPRISARRGRRVLARLASAPWAVHDALGIVFSLITERKRWLIGAIAYWGCDIATLWTCFQAFGSPPTVAVIVMAYFVGTLANSLPLPGGLGGVEAGMVGASIAFGTHASLAIYAASPTASSLSGCPRSRPRISNTPHRRRLESRHQTAQARNQSRRWEALTARPYRRDPRKDPRSRHTFPAGDRNRLRHQQDQPHRLPGLGHRPARHGGLHHPPQRARPRPPVAVLERNTESPRDAAMSSAWCDSLNLRASRGGPQSMTRHADAARPRRY
jgi:hypothetical protein